MIEAIARIAFPLPAVVLASFLDPSFGLAQVQSSPSAQMPSSSQGQNGETKIIVSGGSDMATYIEAVQANFGKPNVIVTLPTIGGGSG